MTWALPRSDLGFTMGDPPRLQNLILRLVVFTIILISFTMAYHLIVLLVFRMGAGRRSTARYYIARRETLAQWLVDDTSKTANASALAMLVVLSRRSRTSRTSLKNTEQDLLAQVMGLRVHCAYLTLFL